ncbi:17107_t:CDS:2, partial [Dentiscutata erythropus]
MTLRYELEQWRDAIKAYDEVDFDRALDCFKTIDDNAKVHFNIGLIYAALGEHEEACQSFKKSVKLDQYFAVGYFQKGVSNFLLGEFEKALVDFNDALQFLRGNMLVTYEQLGLNFCLYSCEILFNRGICYLNLDQTEQGMADLSLAAKEKLTEGHDVIDEAIQIRGQGFSVFSVPVGVLFRPPEKKLYDVKILLENALMNLKLNPDFIGFDDAEQLKKAQMAILDTHDPLLHPSLTNHPEE